MFEGSTNRWPRKPPNINRRLMARIDLAMTAAIIEAFKAEPVKGADKLLKLQLDLGPYGQRRVFAGIKAAYPDPQLLVGRLVPMVANLTPRQMKFGLSEGMVLAAGPGAPDIFLMTPDAGVKPGDAVG